MQLDELLECFLTHLSVTFLTYFNVECTDIYSKLNYLSVISIETCAIYLNIFEITHL